jgi:hypothetical protein
MGAKTPVKLSPTIFGYIKKDGRKKDGRKKEILGFLLASLKKID